MSMTGASGPVPDEADFVPVAVTSHRAGPQKTDWASATATSSVAGAGPDVRQFLSRVLPWPGDDTPGYVNVHVMGKKDNRPIWSGKPTRNVDQFLQEVARSSARMALRSGCPAHLESASSMSASIATFCDARTSDARNKLLDRVTHLGLRANGRR